MANVFAVGRHRIQSCRVFCPVEAAVIRVEAEKLRRGAIEEEFFSAGAVDVRRHDFSGSGLGVAVLGPIKFTGDGVDIDADGADETGDDGAWIGIGRVDFGRADFGEIGPEEIAGWHGQRRAVVVGDDAVVGVEGEDVVFAEGDGAVGFDVRVPCREIANGERSIFVLVIQGVQVVEVEHAPSGVSAGNSRKNAFVEIDIEGRDIDGVNRAAEFAQKISFEIELAERLSGAGAPEGVAFAERDSEAEAGGWFGDDELRSDGRSIAAGDGENRHHVRFAVLLPVIGSDDDLRVVAAAADVEIAAVVGKNSRFAVAGIAFPDQFGISCFAGPAVEFIKIGGAGGGDVSGVDDAVVADADFADRLGAAGDSGGGELSEILAGFRIENMNTHDAGAAAVVDKVKILGDRIVSEAFFGVTGRDAFHYGG